MAKDVATVPSSIKSWSTPRKDPAAFKLPWANHYTEEIADRICEEIAGGRILSRISIEEPWCPTLSMLSYWMGQKPEFRQAYEMALQLRAETMAHEIVEIADNSLDHEQSKLMISARQWLAARMNRKRYGDKQTIETTNKTEVEVRQIETIDVSHLTLEEIHQAEALLMKTIEGEVSDGD